MRPRGALAIGLSCLAKGAGADLNTGGAAARRKLRGRPSRGSRDLVSNGVGFDPQPLPSASTGNATEAEDSTTTTTTTTTPTEAAEVAAGPPAAPRTVCTSIIAVSAAYSPNATYTDLAGRAVPHGDGDAAGEAAAASVATK